MQIQREYTVELAEFKNILELFANNQQTSDLIMKPRGLDQELFDYICSRVVSSISSTSVKEEDSISVVSEKERVFPERTLQNLSNILIKAQIYLLQTDQISNTRDLIKFLIKSKLDPRQMTNFYKTADLDASLDLYDTLYQFWSGQEEPDEQHFGVEEQCYSVLDQVSFVPIIVPARTSKCTHLQCYDLNTLMNLKQCPFCGVQYKLEDIYIDKFIKMIMQCYEEMKIDVKQFKIDKYGNIDVV
ncbi:MIZ/SP-RING_zinc finger domain-containing protein [Hexamita inflata]|uniref:MIZ/SP-RING zinc finger domain-containing protein n=1 Tax=Hexamita inflata TaxID=28002 RepID=A0AA86ULY8_9EUKA|nr:MIZ/SP-RING zinc finger domain-containing protein [Hexamita inflata]